MEEQIKMFIADEEVVSDKEFTINEEILSASSTILNNCYPKSWELDRDYISRFYYPKDYSKFVIGKGDFQYGDDEFQDLEITGKNLFDVQCELAKQFDTSGVITNNEYLLEGDVITKASQTSIFFNKLLLEEGTYTIQYVPRLSGTNKIIRLTIRNFDNLTYIFDRSAQIVDGTMNSYTFTLSSQTTIGISIVPGTVNAGILSLSNIQLEKSSQPTSYEPYNQPMLTYETNVEKEWDKFNIYGNTYQQTRSGKNLFNKNGNINGVQETTILDTGVRITQLTSGTYKYNYISLGGTELLGKTVTLSSNIVSSASNKGQLSLYYANSSNPAISLIGNLTTTGSATFTIENSFPSNASRVNLLLYANTNGTGNANDYVDYTNLQIEIGSSATSYEQYGVQPSPDYPSELVNVGYENLFNVDGELYSGTIYRIDNGFRLTNDATYRTLSMILPNPIPPGTYTISWVAKNSTLSNITSGLGISIRNNTSALTSVNVNENGGQFTINSEATRIYIFIISSQATNASITLDDFILTKGTQHKGYVKYGKYGIETTNTGKNLFLLPAESSLNNVNYTINQDGTINLSGIASANTTFYIYKTIEKANIVDGSKYTLSANKALPSGVEIRFEAYNGATWLRHIASPLTSSVQQKTGTANLTNTTRVRYAIYISNGSNSTINNLGIQLEKGDIATSYEPYKSNTQVYTLNEPLRAIGDTKDKLYTQNGVLYIERKIGKIVLNGSENWIALTGVAYKSYYVDSLISAKRTNDTAPYCSNYFTPITNNQRYVNNSFFINSNNRIIISYDDITNVSNFKTWLSNHNTEIQYILATPVVETYNQVSMPSAYNGDNYINIDSGLDTRSEIWYYWRNYNVLFAGVVKNSGDISLNPRYPHYCSLQVLDYKTFLSESDTLDFVIDNKTIVEAIQMVVDAVSGYGFILGNIDITQGQSRINAYSTLNKTAYDVFQYLADISGSRWRARYIDSSSMAIDFYDPELLPQANDIDYTKEYWEDNNIVDLTFNYGTRDYRNKQIILSKEVYASIEYMEALLSNGYNTKFTTQNNIAQINSITINGTAKTFATQEQKELGLDADFYYIPGKNTLESESSYTAGTQIIITYIPLVKGRQIVFNNDEVGRISTQTNTIGVISRYENRNDILSNKELEQIAKTYIEYKGKAEIILTLTTHNKDLFEIGNITYFNAPIDDLKQIYMVKTKKTQYIVNGSQVNLFYVYELTSSFNSEKAINYFDNQRNKAEGNIQEGESITRNIDINNSATIIWDNSTITEISVTVDGDNVLNSALNSPFIE